MDLVRMEAGQDAPIDSDCIGIEPFGQGKYKLTGSALCGDESVALISDMLFDTPEQAEGAGVAWAELQGVDTLHISRSRG